MKLMRAATLSVADIERSVALYTEWLDYRVEERGTLDEEVAASWGCPRSASRESVVLRPASGHDIFLRFIEKRTASGVRTAANLWLGSHRDLCPGRSRRQ